MTKQATPRQRIIETLKWIRELRNDRQLDIDKLKGIEDRTIDQRLDIIEKIAEMKGLDIAIDEFRYKFKINMDELE